MNFEYYLTEQFRLHPSICPQDVAKLCYQAAFGAEHLLSDLTRAKQYLYKELEATPATDTQPLWEQISEQVCRINLSAWKQKGLDPEKLFDLFAASAQIPSGSSELFHEYLTSASGLISRGLAGFSTEEWDNFLSEYKKSGMPAVHHSDAYRLAEHPAYRIVRKELLTEELFRSL